MPTFNYVALELRTGVEVSRTLKAVTEAEAICALMKRDLLVVSIRQKLDKKGRTAGGRVSTKDLVLFTRQFATMVDAGMAMLPCLNGLAKQTKSKLMRDVIKDICARIERGDSLSDALASHPRVFDKLYLCMIVAGEKAGLLPEVLSRLATYMENAARLQHKVKSALMYPTVVSVVAISITILLLVKVVPIFGDIFDSFKGKLPAPTRFLLVVSNFVQAWLIPILFAIGGTVYAWFFFIKTRFGRALWDSWRIKLPVFGEIAHSICLARFARTFSSLLRSGVPILSVMETASKVCVNVAMQKAVDTASEDIERGEGISDSLAKHPVFPDMMIRMMSAGEQTGRIDEMMERVADHLDEEIETTLSGLTSMIEPILIVFLGVVIGGIVICMFLPLFKLSSLVGGNH